MERCECGMQPFNIYQFTSLRIEAGPSALWFFLKVSKSTVIPADIVTRLTLTKLSTRARQSSIFAFFDEWLHWIGVSFLHVCVYIWKKYTSGDWEVYKTGPDRTWPDPMTVLYQLLYIHEWWVGSVHNLTVKKDRVGWECDKGHSETYENIKMVDFVEEI